MGFGKKTIKNMGVVGGIQAFTKILNAIALVVLARLLEPSDFGILALAYLLILFAEQMQDFGMGKAIIYQSEDVETALYTGFTIRSSLSLTFAVVAFIIAPLWAGFFDNPLLTQPLRVLILVILFQNFSFIPYTKLLKELRFREAEIPNLLGRTANAIVSIILAFKGFSYWSLIYGRVAQSLVRAVFLFIYHPWKAKFKFNTTVGRELLGYGGFVMASMLILIFKDNLDNAVIGKIVGSAALGYYLIAYKWAGFGTKEMSQVINKVLFPTYTHISKDLPRLGSAYLKSLRYATLLSIPLAFGTFAIAPEFVTIVLGAKWTPAITPLRILCLWSLFKSISDPSANVFYSIGKPQLTTYINGLELVLMGVLIVPAAQRHGIIGVSAIVSILSFITSPLSFLLLSKNIKIRITQLLSMLFPQTLASTVMAAAILAFEHYTVKLNIYPPLYLILLIVLGMAAYASTLFILSRKQLQEDLDYLKRNLTKG